MKKATALLVLSLLATTATGCFHNLYRIGPYDAHDTPKESGWNHHFLLGLVNASDDTNMNGMCDFGIGAVEDYRSVGNVIVTVLTLSIWSPTTYRVYCLRPTAPPTAAPLSPAPPSVIVIPGRTELTPGETIEIGGVPRVVTHVWTVDASEIAVLMRERPTSTVVASTP